MLYNGLLNASAFPCIILLIPLILSSVAAIIMWIHFKSPPKLKEMPYQTTVALQTLQHGAYFTFSWDRRG
jgi:hypothetical protein